MFSRVPQDRQARPLVRGVICPLAADVNFLHPPCHDRPLGRAGRMSCATAFLLPGDGYHCPWLDVDRYTFSRSLPVDFITIAYPVQRRLV